MPWTLISLKLNAEKWNLGSEEEGGGILLQTRFESETSSQSRDFLVCEPAAWGKRLMNKNQRSNISWDCSFNILCQQWRISFFSHSFRILTNYIYQLIIAPYLSTEVFKAILLFVFWFLADPWKQGTAGSLRIHLDGSNRDKLKQNMLTK